MIDERYALYAMVNQFAHYIPSASGDEFRDGIIQDGALSALEEAFAALGIPGGKNGDGITRRELWDRWRAEAELQ